MRLQFDGYDEEKAESGFLYGYYTGEYRIVTKSGKTYIGKIFQILCNSFTFSSYGAAYLEYVGMWDEDPDYNPWGIENVDVENNTGVRKMFIDGQLYIIRDSVIYTIQGARVR